MKNTNSSLRRVWYHLKIVIIIGIISGTLAWASPLIYYIFESYLTLSSKDFYLDFTNFRMPYLTFLNVTLFSTMLSELIFSISKFNLSKRKWVFGLLQASIVYGLFFYAYSSSLMNGCYENLNEWFSCVSMYSSAFRLVIWLPIFFTFIVFNFFSARFIEYQQKLYPND